MKKINLVKTMTMLWYVAVLMFCILLLRDPYMPMTVNVCIYVILDKNNEGKNSGSLLGLQTSDAAVYCFQSSEPCMHY